MMPEWMQAALRLGSTLRFRYRLGDNLILDMSLRPESNFVTLRTTLFSTRGDIEAARRVLDGHPAAVDDDYWKDFLAAWDYEEDAPCG